ncbi:PhzF family phenazine biosynthesis protein [Fodinibius salsisoli]|uniref:PhzF family phenazine biosynthesis protein n=1 Tax=Fodinibius salsisoli TaxID=2820877 RepID=A0ABT3PNT5_9BACT|nr:PhzF family phenazine biosynthesis protein [Fodinibius salsisoli]MCW9707519.1 PhzF family phenazine biosynthesis protein [Fodinibius salsisoli]
MTLPIYQVDAFATEIFAGNPAAICPLEEWLPKEQMQKIAMENNLAETAFFVKEENGYRLRWFTPVTEVQLCGHATLASAHVLFKHLGYEEESIKFQTLSGPLTVRREGEQLVMDFPASTCNVTEAPPLLEQALGVECNEVYSDMDHLCVLDTEQEVLNLTPNMRLLAQIDGRGVIVTAPADEEEADFVSRFFAPAVGVDEDPVTGSAHTMLTPYWSKVLGKNRLVGRQLSKRGGTVNCELKGDRVILSGQAKTYLKGEITL